MQLKLVNVGFQLAHQLVLKFSTKKKSWLNFHLKKKNLVNFYWPLRKTNKKLTLDSYRSKRKTIIGHTSIR